MDPDQMGLHQKPADLNLQCIQNKDKPDSAGQGLIIIIQ